MILATIALLAALSFVLSSSAGMGGSLILVPLLSLTIGTKEGVALAALLLGGNNVVKAVLYRKSIPLRASGAIVAATLVGAAMGASLFMAAAEEIVTCLLISVIVATFVLEHRGPLSVRRGLSPVMAFFAGATSGFSGTSGPLKGIAIRSLGLSRAQFVGAASAVSCAGDLIKTALFTKGGLVDGQSLLIAAVCVPIMIGASLTGRYLNQRIGETGYAVLFWAVMSGYALRLVI